MDKVAKEQTKVFGVWGLAALTFAFLANANATPQLATFGLGAILIVLMAIFFFLTPTAMASAEMGAAWPRTGGIYVWTRLAFGEGTGFMIIWLEWANFVVAWPSIMGSLIIQTSFLIDPALGSNTTFIVAVVILVTWIGVAFALRGLRATQKFAWYGVIAGTVIPSVVIAVVAATYLMQGNAPAMDVSWEAMTSGFSSGNLAFISGALLMFSGIEIAAVHAADVRDPGRTIPRANLIAVILCLVFLLPYILGIATIIPSEDINLVTGMLQAGQAYFDALNISWMMPIFGILFVTGFAAALIQIINGPSRGLLVAGRQGGNLPPWMQKENANRMPVAIILVQGALSSVLSLGYLFLGSVQNAWFMFALIQTNMVLIMYVIMFAALVKLRRSQASTPRPYRIPGKKLGLAAVVGGGVIVCMFGILVSFQPTDEAGAMPTWLYVAVLLVGTVAFVAMPFIFWIFRKPSWRTEVSSLSVEDAEALH